MRTKALTLAFAAVTALALIAGGVGASELGTVHEQPDQSTDTPEQTKYDEKLTADESFTMNLNDEDVETEVVGNEEYDEKLTADESFTMNLHDEDVEMEVVGNEEYDEKLTADESFTMNLHDEDVETEVVSDT
ncbi:hypothetical protein [Halovenus sp. HT40]|uniref:hypothetical protein n=1 Tax=Halovenus sp. HT40 TaxID=3126691 RepID=UPI00300F592D